MARLDSGVPVGSAKQRGFPWRLWLYAIAVTGAAGGAGYFAYQYRDKANTATADLATRPKSEELAACKSALGDATTKLAEGSKTMTATAAELAALRAQKADADKRNAAIEEFRKQFEKMVQAGELRVVARHGELVLSLPSEVLFPTGSAQLSKTGEYAVVELGAILKRFPERKFLIVGHTDNQDFAKPKGTPGAGSGSDAPPPCIAQDNWQLSTERALTVVRVLTTAGMKAENLIPAGQGDHDPVASNATPDGRQRNRRIEIALLPAVNELPKLPDTIKEDTGAPTPKK